MPTTQEYINQLKIDKQTLVDNLASKGISDLSGTETFTELVPKVLDIQTGGGDVSEYYDFPYIKNNTYGGRIARAIKKIPNFDTSDWTNFDNLFEYCNSLLEVPQINTSNGTSFSNMFNQCYNLTSIPQLDTSNGTNFSSMFNQCYNLTSIPQLDTSKGANFNGMLSSSSKITNLGGFVNLGKGYVQKANNYFLYKLDLSSCTKLTYDSLINLMNNLYDLNLTYDVANGGTLYTQSLSIGPKNMEKLEATTEGQEALALTVAKGWTIS